MMLEEREEWNGERKRERTRLKRREMQRSLAVPHSHETRPDHLSDRVEFGSDKKSNTILFGSYVARPDHRAGFFWPEPDSTHGHVWSNPILYV